MLDSTSLTRAWLALPLKVMASVPPPVVSVPTVTPEMITSPPAVNTTLPRAKGVVSIGPGGACQRDAGPRVVACAAIKWRQ